ncbi:MAG: hypothetical protein DRI69_09335 [Bacteroidetes bacterium]|nr:MAG: hypothetical protein DRI69_09335 [Bacteroidota bacterium]
MLLVFSLAATSVMAGNPINSEDNVAGIVSMDDAYSSKAMTKADMRASKRADKMALKAEKKQIRQEKRMTKINNFIAKHFGNSALGGLDDPIDKFLWWAIIAAGVAIIFSFIYWPISTIFWIGSIVLLVLWIIKKYG